MTARDPIELTGGAWVWNPRRGCREWVPEPTADETADMLLAVLERIETHLPYTLTGHICDDCGCALRTATELCPNCAIDWCERAAEQGRRLQQERAWRRADLGYLRRKGAAA